MFTGSAREQPLQPEAAGENEEWIETDGPGGFASGTVTGLRTRRYHALLLTATHPPTGRMVLINGVEAQVKTATGVFPLTTQRYAPDVVHPRGFERIVAFANDPWPTWTFRFDEETEVVYEVLCDCTWIRKEKCAGSSSRLAAKDFWKRISTESLNRLVNSMG
jgi:hypothetical protein